jgi:hypothetical protein
MMQQPVMMQQPAMMQPQVIMMGGQQFKTPPECCFKCCCPICAVVSHEGCGGPAILALFLGCFFTNCCWAPARIPL